MSALIETPYGPKSPELLCKAMDAHTLLPDLLAALEDIIKSEDVEYIHGVARDAITKAKEIRS